jgi:hypothetical protein
MTVTRSIDPTNTHASHTIAPQGGVGFDDSHTGHVVNLNLPQPFYQTATYGLAFSPGNIAQHGLVPDVRLPRTTAAPYPLHADRVASEKMSNRVRNQITRTLREFGFTPKGHVESYQKSYPKCFDIVPYPQGFRVPNFVKFTGDDSITTYEHIG